VAEPAPGTPMSGPALPEPTARRVPNGGTPPNQLPPTAAAWLFVVLAAAAFASVFGGSGLIDAVSFQPTSPGGSYGPTAFLYGTEVVGAAVLAVTAARYRQAWVTVSERGIEVGSDAVRWEARWSSLGPSTPPRGRWAPFTVRAEDGRRARTLFVTRSQARAMLAAPGFPAERFPPELWTWAGLGPPPDRAVPPAPPR